VIDIRKIHKGEESQAKKLITSIMDAEFSQAKGSYPTDDLDAIADHYGHLGEAFFVAVEEGKVIGTVAVKKDDERTALLRRIFVSPDHRKQKIGYRLMQKAIDFCKEVGYQEIVFKSTALMNAANQLCLANGFQEKARIPLGMNSLVKFALFLKENSPLAV
jgi:GNAT superfamily N-acetyltransferase